MRRLAGVGGQTEGLFYFLAWEKLAEGGTFSSEQGGKRPKHAERGERKKRDPSTLGIAAEQPVWGDRIWGRMRKNKKEFEPHYRHTVSSKKTNWTHSQQISVTRSVEKKKLQSLLKIKQVALKRWQTCCESEVKASLSQSVGFSHKHTDTRWRVAPSDPLHVAKDEDEQGPEEDCDDSGPDEDYNLHVGLVTWALRQRKTEKNTLLDAGVVNNSLEVL